MILKSIKCCLLVVTLSFAVHNTTSAQEVGLSFSYFIPKGGYVSTPVSPFSIRGVGVSLGRYFAVQTGFSLYRMAGLNIKDIEDFESNKPLLGPNFTMMVPLEGVIQFVGRQQEFRLKGGGFAFWGFDNKLNYGNIDEAIREAEGWIIADADFNTSHGIGLGFFFGAEYVVYVTDQWGLSFEGNYFIGGAPIELEGTYRGNAENAPLETRNVSYPDSQVDYTGLEISIGILFGG